MASFVSDSIFASLKTQFEDAMRNLVISIAEGEGLDARELMHKYLVNVIPATAEAKGKGPATKPRKAKVTVKEIDPDKTKAVCSCLTAKGKPCSLKPMLGTEMCSVHTKKAASKPLPAEDDDVEEMPVVDKKKKSSAKSKKDDSGAGPSTSATKKTKKIKVDAPVHTHELDDEVHDDCELCQTHGCPLEDMEDEYETVMSPPRTLCERLRRAAVVDSFVDDDD